jgi:hypothetical protein
MIIGMVVSDFQRFPLKKSGNRYGLPLLFGTLPDQLLK